MRRTTMTKKLGRKASAMLPLYLFALLANFLSCFICSNESALAQSTVQTAETPDQEEDQTSSDLVVHRIIPSDTDANIDTFTGNGFNHWSYAPLKSAAQTELVVFLPGTGGKGRGSGKFNRFAAGSGYHLLSLAYPDTISMSKFRNMPDPDAFSRARTNVINGRVQFGGLGVNSANSIENRLLMLLRYLSEHFPTEGWAAFLNKSGDVIWEKIILSGQSQGGGHACFMAMELHKVARVLMFGSPKDFSPVLGKPAKWMFDESMTPLNRLFCFNHSDDDHNGCTYEQQVQNYKALRLSPYYPIVDVDSTAAPYMHSRLLTSRVHQESAHGAPVHDNRYLPVWQYMLTEPVQ